MSSVNTTDYLSGDIPLINIPHQEQSKVLCSLWINQDPSNIEHAYYRNTSDWTIALSYDYTLARFYDSSNRQDITPEEFFDIYLTVTPTRYDLFEHLPTFLYSYDNQMFKMFQRNPNSIFSVPSTEIVEKLLLEYPSSFVDCDLTENMYSRILMELINKCGRYVRFYVALGANVSDETNRQVYHMAVNQDGMALEYIPCPDNSVIDAALSQNKAAIGFCTDEALTYERLRYCLDPIDDQVVEIIGHRLKDRGMINDLVRYRGSLIRFFKMQQDEDLQNIAIEQDPMNLQYCLMTRDNRRVRERAVSLDGRALKYCGAYKTKQLCIDAFNNAGMDCVESIPSKWRDDILAQNGNGNDETVGRIVIDDDWDTYGF